MPPLTPLTIGIQGATGRMGVRLIQLIREAPDLVLGAAVDRPDHPRLGEDIGVALGLGTMNVPLRVGLDRPVRVMIDFSAPVASMALAADCAEEGVPLVIGTTGFDSDQREELKHFATRTPMLIASNFSKAVNLLMRLVEIAASSLGDAADIEIVERHHHFKKDAPSGTALRLAEIAAQAIGSNRFVHGRHGVIGERPRGEIGLHALRTGDNPGEHTVVFGLMGECLELSHRALNREGFALGALDAARFLADKPPGLYSMDDLLG
ncbi:4-hydroxy-tetrahydrodipicolinate reductase [soil metagenome]